jgi:hypothetical protein
MVNVQYCMCPTLNYAAGIWGFKEFKTANTTKKREPYNVFWEVYKFAPILAIQGDMG